MNDREKALEALNRLEALWYEDKLSLVHFKLFLMGHMDTIRDALQSPAPDISIDKALDIIAPVDNFFNGDAEKGKMMGDYWHGTVISKHGKTVMLSGRDIDELKENMELAFSLETKIKANTNKKNTKDIDLIAPVANFFNGDAEKTKSWFKTENPMLGGISPNEMIARGRIEKLKEFIDTQLQSNGVEVINLNKEEWDEFNETLDRPTEVKPDLSKLLKSDTLEQSYENACKLCKKNNMHVIFSHNGTTYKVSPHRLGKKVHDLENKLFNTVSRSEVVKMLSNLYKTMNSISECLREDKFDDHPVQDFWFYLWCEVDQAIKAVEEL